jgi:hypothetical protein
MNVAEPPIAESEKLEGSRFRHHSDKRSALIVLMGITALMFSGLELEVLTSLDGMLRFMTVREILEDVGAAFIPLFCVAVGWWLCLMLFMKVVQVFGWEARDRESVFWRLGLTIPLIYFALELLNSTRLRISPHWHPGLFGWLWMAPLLVAFCVASICLPIGKQILATQNATKSGAIHSQPNSPGCQCGEIRRRVELRSSRAK